MSGAIEGAFELTKIEVVDREKCRSDRGNVVDIKISIKNISSSAVCAGVVAFNGKTKKWGLFDHFGAHYIYLKMFSGGAIIDSGETHTLKLTREEYHLTLCLSDFQVGEFQKDAETKVYSVPGRIRKPFLRAWRLENN
jgi:hypothetical protein